MVKSPGWGQGLEGGDGWGQQEIKAKVKSELGCN